MRLKHTVCCLAVLLTSSFVSNASTAADPVTDFIAGADSAATAGGDDALNRFVSENAILVGAAVGQLLDVAIALGNDGQPDAEAEQLSLAERIAVAYERHTASEAPLRLVRTCRGWDESQRTLRRRAKELEEQATRAQQARDFPTAIQRLEEARAIYEEIHDDRSLAIIWGTFGVVYWYAGNLEAVRENYERALAARRAIEDRIWEGKTLNGMGSVNLQTGNFAEAENWYKEAIALRQKTGDLAGLATSLTYLGNVYLESRRLVDARTQYEKALHVVEAVGGDQQRFELLSSVARLSYETGHMQRAEQANRKALEVAVRTNDVPNQILVRNNLVGVLQAQGRFREALDELGVIEQLLEQHPDPAQELLLRANRGAVHIDLGEVDRAQDELLAFLAEAERLNEPGYQIQALVNLGHLCRSLGAFETGLSYTDRARALAAATGDPQRAREVLVLTASLERNLGRYDESLGHFQEALALDRSSGADVLAIEDEIGIANVNLAQGKAKEARTRYRALLPKIYESRIHTLQAATLFGIGHSFENEQPDSAAFYYEKALGLLERTRAAIGGAEVRASFLGAERRYYYEEVTRYYARVELQGRGETGEWSARAFHTIERAKARGLLDLLHASILAKGSPEEDALLDEMYRIRAKPQSDERRREERQLEAQYVEVREQRLSHAFGATDDGGNVLDLEAVQSELTAGTLLLEYALGDTNSLLWAIDRASQELFELPNRQVIGRQVDLLRDAVKTPGAGDRMFLKASNTLYEMLVSVAAERISKAKRVVIIPDGKLFELPFEALLTKPAGRGYQWNELPFLARSLAPTYAPSASVYLRLERAKTRKHTRDLLAFGDPDYSSLEIRRGRQALDPLPHTRSEVLAVSARVDEGRRSVYLGKDASEAALKREIRNGPPRILHLATHGLVDPAEPAASSVVLSADQEAGEDGYLYTLEILSLPFDVDLVIVSACESARGKIGRGEGVVGLSRSFLASGARGVVASLWAVSDESTSVLMTKFYEEMISEKKTAAEALNEARLSMMDEPDYSHPFHWSAFVFIGADRSLW